MVSFINFLVMGSLLLFLYSQMDQGVSSIVFGIKMSYVFAALVFIFLFGQVWKSKNEERGLIDKAFRAVLTIATMIVSAGMITHGNYGGLLSILGPTFLLIIMLYALYKILGGK